MLKRGEVRVGMMAVAIVLAGWLSWTTFGQTVTDRATNSTPGGAASSRFEFLVVESFDARYLQDTPGHRGRAASGRVAPRIALFDPVMRGTTQIGEVTHLEWNEARESLEVEFNPRTGMRICIGDPVWVPIPTTPPR